MKKMLCIIPITFLAFLLLIGVGNQTCLADPIYGNGESIILIDGTGETPANTTVAVNISEFGISGSSLYYSTDVRTTWTPITFDTNGDAQFSSEGGDILDFKLNYSSKDYFSNNSKHATLKYSGGIEATFAEKPNRSNPYYGTLYVEWLGIGGFCLDALTTPTAHDGFAPVPIPSSVLLLGAGLLGLIGIGFRRRKERKEM